MPPSNKPDLWFDFMNKRNHRVSGETVMKALLNQTFAVLNEHGRANAWINEITGYTRRQGADAKPRVICKITAKYVNLYAKEIGPAMSILGPIEAQWYAPVFPSAAALIAIASINYVERTDAEKAEFRRIMTTLIDEAPQLGSNAECEQYAMNWLRPERRYWNENGRYPHRLQQRVPMIKAQLKPLFIANNARYFPSGLREFQTPVKARAA